MTRFADLSTGTRLAVFAILLALVGGGAAALGAASGIDVKPEGDGIAMSDEHGVEGPAARANGLATAAGGFSFEPERTSFDAGRSEFRFRVVDADGATARTFDLEGGVRMHLIVVRRDLTGYRHVHPRLQADGSWSVALDLREPGAYRAFADFEVGGQKTVLGRDLFVAGDSQPLPLPPVERTVTVAGYEIELAPEELLAGEPTVLDFAIRRNGVPVEGFQEYVGMRGHLIALRDGDLAYYHLHTLEESRTGRIGFEAELPMAGTYRLFVQFKVGGRVVTAPFTVEVER